MVVRTPAEQKADLTHEPQAKQRRRWSSPMAAYALAALTFVVVAFLLHTSLKLSRSRALSEARLQVSAELGQVRARLEDNISINANIVQGLAAVVATEPNMEQDRFAQFAKHLLSGRNQIRHVGAAPNLVVKLLYPLEGNEAVLGLDYTKNEEQRSGVMQAIAADQAIVVGPVNLIQGGTGLIARLPVYTATDTARRGRFWGLVSTVIDVPRLFRDSGITDSERAFDVAVRRDDRMNKGGDFIYGDPVIADHQPVMATVSIPGGQWQLLAVPKHGWPTASPDQSRILITYFLAAAFIVIPLLLVGRLLSQRRKDDVARDIQVERLRKLEEVGRVGGWRIDRATYRQHLTHGMSAILELPASEDADPCGEPEWSWPDSSVDQELREAARVSMVYGAQLDITVKTVTAKGRPIWLHVRAEPVRANGEIIGLSGYAQDISLQHQLQEKVMTTHKMEAIGQLTAGIAHDFNNVLGAISLNVEMIADDPTTPEFQSKRAQVAKKACGRGANLTRQLLAFARKQSLVAHHVDLCKVVGGTATLLKHTLPTSIDVKVVVAPELAAWAEIDEAHFDSAILNLGLNARDAMPDGGTLLISVTTREIVMNVEGKNLRPGRYAVVSVDDTGVGMSEAVLARAFDPFFTTKDFGQGSGLGLSMVHGFVCQSGGDIEIRSRIGQGTTIEMFFPLLEPAHEDVKAEATPAATFNGKAKRALLVEDMADIREACQIQLESLGFNVVAAHNGPAACRLIAEDDDFDVLITDLDMPGGINGNRLAEVALRAIPGLKVITMTGYNEGHLKANSEFKTSERRIHLQKPFSRSDLATALSRVVPGLASAA
jgi:sensor domain CHASE-containing protein/nitrogen-specific signal transduction histidine kinase/ActR/RegA family two-component response regulator